MWPSVRAQAACNTFVVVTFWLLQNLRISSSAICGTSALSGYDKLASLAQRYVEPEIIPLGYLTGKLFSN